MKIFNKKQKKDELTKMINFRLPKNEYIILKSIAQNQQVSMSGICRNLLYAFYRRNAVAFDDPKTKLKYKEND